MEPADLSRVIERIAVALGVSDQHARRHLSKLILLLGPTRIDELRVEAERLVALRPSQAGEPMGSVRDMFFALAVQHLNQTQRLIVFGPLGWQGVRATLPDTHAERPPPRLPRTSARSLAWSERKEAIASAQGTHGAVQSALVTLSGTPDKIINVNETIIMLLTDTRTPRLPPGLPAPPPTPTQYVVYLNARRWRRIAPQMADSTHTLIITGWACYDPTVRRIVVFAQRAAARQTRPAS